MKPRLLIVILVYALISGCLSPRPWCWGPPVRNVIGDSGRPVMIYESHTVIDRGKETLRDPSQIVSDTPPARGGAVEDFDCTMYFEIDNDRDHPLLAGLGHRHRFAGCLQRERSSVRLIRAGCAPGSKAAYRRLHPDRAYRHRRA